MINICSLHPRPISDLTNTSGINTFSTVPVRIPGAFFTDWQKLILKFIWKSKGPRTAKIILKNSKVGRVTFSNFQTYYEGTVGKTVWCWHKDRHADQWNRVLSPQKPSYMQSNLEYNETWFSHEKECSAKAHTARMDQSQARVKAAYGVTPLIRSTQSWQIYRDGK